MRVHVPTVLDIARQAADQRRMAALEEGSERLACSKQIQMDSITRAKGAHVALVAAAAEMLRIERTQGVGDDEAEAAIEALDAALMACDPRIGRQAQVTAWASWLAETSDDELRMVFASRPDLAARLSLLLQPAAS